MSFTRTRAFADKKRLSQRGVLPTAIKSRNLSDFIFGSEDGTATTTLANGEQAVVSFTLSQDNEFALLGVNYVSIYLGTTALAGNQLPGGSGVDESEWQVIGPFYNHNAWEGGGFPRHIEYSRLYIRNISAGTTSLLIENRWRYISPREGSA